MTTASSIITQGSVKPGPRLARDDLAHMALRNTKPRRDFGLRHRSGHAPDAPHLSLGQLAMPLLSAANRRSVDDFVSVIPGARIPSQVSRVAAERIAAVMRNLGSGKRLRAMRAMTNRTMGQRTSPAIKRPIEMPVACGVSGVGPKQTFFAREPGCNLVDEALRFSRWDPSTARVSMIAPPVIVHLAPTTRQMRLAAAGNRTGAEGRHVSC